MSVVAGAGQGGVGRGPQWTTGVAWNPLLRQEAEADTLFLLDPAAEQAAGYTPGHDGFLFGRGFAPDSQWTKMLVVPGKYRAGLVLAQPVDSSGTHGPLWMPVRHLLNPREWTLECWLACDADWSAVVCEHPVHVGGKRPFALGLDLLAGTLSLSYGYLSVSYPAAPGGFAAGTFYSVAATYSAATGLLVLYVGGARVAQLTGVEPISYLQEVADADGLLLHGYVGGSMSGGHCTLSDLRLSGRARTPGAPLWVSDGQMVGVHAGRPTGTDINRRLAGTVFGGGAVQPQDGAGVPTYYTQWGPAREGGAVAVLRADHFLEATPMVAGAPTVACPSAGASGAYSYNWACLTDIVVAKTRALGQGLHLSLDFTPSLLGGQNTPRLPPNTWAGMADSACKMPPSSYSAFATLCSDLVAHIYADLGQTDLSVGLWNEPDGSTFWSGTLGDPSVPPASQPATTYLGLYAAVMPAIKALSSAILVGGPETATLNVAWISALIRFCALWGLPLDFISYHDYSGDSGGPANARTLLDGWLVQEGMAAGLPLIVGEFNWNNAALAWYPFAYGNPDATTAPSHNDASAAFLAQTLLQAQAAGGIRTLVYTFCGTGEDGPPGSVYGAMGLQTPAHAWAPLNVYRQWGLLPAHVCATSSSGGRAIWALASVDSTTAPTTVGLLLVQNRYRTALGESLVGVSVDGFTAQSYQQYTVDDRHANYIDTGGQSSDLSVTAQGTFAPGAAPSADNPLWVTLRPRSSTLLLFH